LIPWFTSFFLRDFSPEIAIAAINGFVSNGPSYLFVTSLALLSFLFPEITPITFTDLMYGNSLVRSTISGSASAPLPLSSDSSNQNSMDYETFTLRLAGISKRDKNENQTIKNISLDMFIVRVREFGGKSENHSILDKFSDFFSGFI
jgi:hypothetical protein